MIFRLDNPTCPLLTLQLPVTRNGTTHLEEAPSHHFEALKLLELPPARLDYPRVLKRRELQIAGSRVLCMVAFHRQVVLV